jgi:hypothetical protein
LRTSCGRTRWSVSAWSSATTAPFIGCLITLDAEALPGWLEGRDRPTGTAVAELVHDSEVVAEIQKA